MATHAAASARIVHLSRLAGAQVGEMIQFIPISPFPCCTFRYIIHGPSLPWRRRLPAGSPPQKSFRPGPKWADDGICSDRLPTPILLRLFIIRLSVPLAAPWRTGVQPSTGQSASRFRPHFIAIATIPAGMVSIATYHRGRLIDGAHRCGMNRSFHPIVPHPTVEPRYPSIAVSTNLIRRMETI